MNKKINLEEIIAKTWDCTDLGNLQLDIILNPDLDRFKVAMLEACKQLLELAAKNSKIEIKTVGEELIITDIHQEDNYTRIQVNISSILNTIKQVE